MESPIVHCSHSDLVDPKRLKPHPRNPNRHPPKQIEMFVSILEYSGWRRPVTVSKRSGYITKGHGAYEAAIKAGYSFVPVDYQNYNDEDQEMADIVADNMLQRMSEMDIGAMKEILVDLNVGGFNMELTGIQLDQMQVMLQQVPDDNIRNSFDESKEDEIPDDAPTRVKRGDIWQIGEHRLMCGDSKLDLPRLMNGEKADLLVTDPPYGVSYTDKNEYLNSLGAGHRLTKAIENDSMKPEEMNEFWFQFLSAVHSETTDRASYYICSPQGGDLMMMMMSIIRAKWQLKHMLIWVKNNHVLGRCDYNYKHEPILYGWKEGKTHEFHGNGTFKTSVWEVDKPLKNDLHPTMKPIKLMEEAILNSSNVGGKVIDPFCGSGTTLIACEKTGRKCFGMEIDPYYCDIILARWERLTGRTAEIIRQ